ncbi:MAG TPA: aspartate-semialdehyde dehydrogenase [Dehalococcoidia bacterium]|jgi:aspartate-semialdehyde dehydrogenase|nr:aspartate-semialdehyde dehydrogenase [Chloroflexota bacterium]MDP5878175.1 aspartate-semialdehyde dehydrogenase [Dehalococcoidia bacterium]MDP6273493.1 aspartate-semialdehyde dehydrogenase [Dehalococcoidia bacterium]MDP7161403.1 aspartate-semialdehyde dehydrogenase [Dehalococcoidia bacterium]MDP7213844.1 aspartate-semialdehyde dehydrogenase [Dehalococcoidia bacterium]|tara:strand:+ start:1265 stop:2296 length:1032 start_codon:yes stop_codon:yes gene_type:complete
MSDSNLTIAIVGATGAVGAVALELLADRSYPVEHIIAMASSRSVGKKLAYLETELTVIEATPDAFEGVDVAFISASATVSRALAPEAVKRGAMVIDDGSAFRMDPAVPLVIPEVNGADLEWHSGIVSIPNCTTTPLAMSLSALGQVARVKRVTVATYQAVSGTGAAAVRELDEQSADILAGRPANPQEYPHQIAFNVLPQVDDFTEDGYTGEEHKMINETRKILHDAEIAISPTCVRVPVPVTHSESVQVEFEQPLSKEDATRLLSGFPGITVVDDPQASVYPMPAQASGRDEVFVGRIRADASHPNGLALWIACDNLRKGAALNALQIMDEAVRRGCVKPKC